MKRLATDHVDLIQLHSCSLAELQKGDVVEALEQARAAGQTRYIGYSGDGQAARYAVECGAFDTLQTSVSIADQEAIELTLPLAQRYRMGVIAKRPIANVAWRYTRRPDSYYEDYWMRLKKLDYPFLREPPEAAVATSLRFTLSLPGVHTAIVGTTKPEHWQQDAALLAAGTSARARDGSDSRALGRGRRGLLGGSGVGRRPDVRSDGAWRLPSPASRIGSRASTRHPRRPSLSCRNKYLAARRSWRAPCQ